VVNVVIKHFLILFLLVVFTSGCMYSEEIERQKDNPAFVNEEINRVQSAVENYFEKNKTYPIKNSTEATPIYEKYILDLRKLIQSQLLSSIPKNAFENGGKYYYLLLTPETSPKVKLMDISIFQQADELQKKVNRYALSHDGKLPFGSKISTGFYSLDFKLLNSNEEQIQSMYSENFLPFLLSDSGDVVIDYGLEIYNLLQKQNQREYNSKLDLRTFLIENSPYVPVKSYPYYWLNGEPQITSPNK
jgi:hypothetical protein